MTRQEKALIQIALLRAKILLKEAVVEEFIEAQNCLKKEIVSLYAMLYATDSLQETGIHENLVISENISIKLNGVTV